MKYWITLMIAMFISFNTLAEDCTKVKYDRESFGYDSKITKLELRKRGGLVGKMTWSNSQIVDDYTGHIEDGYAMETDHILPLKWAWDQGACNWSEQDKFIFANDLDNLALTHKFHNRSKGSKGIDKWTPIGTEFDEKYTILWNKAFNKYFK